jgi:hypothetical protein
MKTNLTVLLLFISCTLLAQQQRFVIPLSEQTLLGKALSVNNEIKSTLEIVDLTGDSTLGYVSTTPPSNDRVAIFPPLPKQEWLTTLVHVNNIASSLTSGTSLLLLISDISVGGTQTSSYVRIKAKAYTSLLGSESYSFLKSIDDIHSNNSFGLTKTEDNIIGLIRSIITQTQAKPVINQSSPKIKSDIIKEELNGLSFIAKGIFPSGIYMNYTDFKLLKPSFEHFWVKTDVDSKKVQLSRFTIKDSTLRQVDGAYAVAVGNELYLCKNQKLYPIEVRGNNLVFSKYVDPLHRKNKANFWRNNIGVRFKEWEDSNPFDNRYALEIDNYRGKGVRGEAIKVNSESGTVEL